VEVPYGPLWESLNSDIKININIGDKTHLANINPNIGKCTINYEIPADPPEKFNKTVKSGYKYDLIQESAFVNIWNYEPKNINNGVQANVSILRAEGLYNDASENHLEPDLRVTCLNKSETYKSNASSYRTTVTQAIINELSTHDALLIKLSMDKQTVGDTQNPLYNNLKFKSDTTVYAEATSTIAAEPTYYMVFRLGKYAADYRLGFIKIGADSDTTAKAIFNT
jgi:hypothetical protein